MQPAPPSTDYQSNFAQKNEPVPHISDFLRWADSHRVLNIGQLLTTIVVDPTNRSHPALLGGTLQFLSNQETLHLLTSWSVGRSRITKLAEFSTVAASDFPNLPRPTSSPQIHSQFPGCVPFNFLAAMLCVRRPPGLTLQEIYKLSCLRTWVLVKAVDMYLLHKPNFDQSIKVVSDFVRMAFDDKGDPGKRAWALSLAEPTDEISQYEILLAAGIDKADNEIAGAEACKRAIRSLIQGNHKPLLLPAFDYSRSLSSEFFNELAAPTVVHPDADTRFGDTGGSDTGNSRFPVNESATPAEVARESRAISFQSAEDHQFLPYSWGRPNPHEMQALKLALLQELTNGETTDRLLAAIAVVALICHRSMDTVSTLRFGKVSTDSWQVDPETLVLHKLATRRQNGWKPDATSREWVHDLVDRWDLRLLDPLASVLRCTHRESSNPKYLTDLWHQISEETLENSFNQWCKKQEKLTRLTSGMLVKASEQHAFDESNDHIFSDMLTRPSNSGITGGGSYASFNLAKVATTLTTIAPEIAIAEPTDAFNANAMGSALRPIEDLLIKAVVDAKNRIKQHQHAKEPAWVVQHNQLVGYMVTMLLAATGARPVKSVFEDASHFDLERGRLYMEDKVSPLAVTGKSGRIVPLPPGAVTLLRTVYFPHLSQLAQHIRGSLPELATEIEHQLSGAGSKKLPLFFFIRNFPDFAWMQVSETTLSTTSVFNWPLPWNLFRHRLAIKLRELGVEAEVIDAQLGHIESGSETYGDFSMRCWASDDPSWRNALATAFNTLDWTLSPQPFVAVGHVRIPASYAPFASEALFGATARDARRQRHKKEVRASTLAEIKEFVGKRPLDSIAPEEWEQLGTRMLLKEGNVPQPNAVIRFETYEKYLHDEWRSSGQRPRLRSWFRLKPKAHTAFSPFAINAAQKITPLRLALDSTYHKYYLSEMSKGACGVIAALDLALNAHVCNKSLLHCLSLGDKEHISLIYREKKAFIEYSDQAAEVAHRPVARHLIPSRSAALVEKVLKAGKKLPTLSANAKELSLIMQAPGMSGSQIGNALQLVDYVAQLVDWANSIELTGLLAGVLAGRVATFSLDRQDWLRAWTGLSWINPQSTVITQGSEPHTTDVPLPDSVDLRGSAQLQASLPPTEFDVTLDRQRELARQLFKEIRAALNAYRESAKAPQAAPANDTGESKQREKSKDHTRAENDDRDKARRTTLKRIKESNPQLGTSVLALARWVHHLLSRPFGKRLLDVTSVMTYMDALTNGFLSFAVGVDIADLDADELTDFYIQVIDPAARQTQQSDDADDKVSIVKGRKDQIYVLQRLKEFHQFAAPIYGLDIPDWAEIGEGLSGATASPGFITTAEYLYTLSYLCSDPLTSSISQVRDAFVLLLAFRFGLRGSEAISLMRQEWINFDGAIVVVVSRRLHKLKTRAAQRQIPLLETLDAFELSVIKRYLEYWEAESKGDQKIPLFFVDRTSQRVSEIRPVRERLISALRIATENSHTNLHHARHSFANRAGIYILLAGNEPSLWSRGVPTSNVIGEDVKKKMLCNTVLTRRSIWAVSRLLGHAGPITTAGSYLHILHDLSNSTVEHLQPALFAQIPVGKIDGTVDLDTWSPSTSYLQVRVVEPQARPIKLTPFLALRYFELRANGMLKEPAVSHLNISPFWGNLLEDGLSRLGERLIEDAPKSNPELLNKFYPMALLGKIEAHRWQELLKFAAGLEGIYDNFKLSDTPLAGKTRQLLIWEPEHLVLVSSFLKKCNWGEGDVAFYRSSKLDTALETAAAESGISFQSKVDENKRKLIQIDRLWIDIGNGKMANIPHVIAMVRGASNKNVATNFELFALWLAVTLSPARVQTIILSKPRFDD